MVYWDGIGQKSGWKMDENGKELMGRYNICIGGWERSIDREFLERNYVN